jgi:4-amino-4-deoxy-L-arabinose transferase-like glycosyltransferase
VIVGAIALLGLHLRLVDYNRIPAPGATHDEFMYPWAGMSLLQTGVPTSWSRLQTYGAHQDAIYNGAYYPLVTPWVHKPLLYPLLTGSVMLLAGITEFSEVDLSILRLIPVFLGTVTTVLVAIAGAAAFNRSAGLLAALLYATTPTMVIASRLSLIENALAPLLVLAIIVQTLPRQQLSGRHRQLLIGVVAATAVLLKQIGIVVAATLFIYHYAQRRYREASSVATWALAAAAIFIGIGSYYVGLKQFIVLQQSANDVHAEGGLPQLLISIVTFPMIIGPNSTLPGAPMLAGYLALLSAPWWLSTSKGAASRREARHLLILLPVMYLIILVLLESSKYSFRGWHLYPIFPFLSIFLAAASYRLYMRGTFLQLLAAFLILSPTLAPLVILFPALTDYWQIILGVSAVATLAAGIKPSARQTILTGMLAILISTNILMIYGASRFLHPPQQPSAHEELRIFSR